MSRASTGNRRNGGTRIGRPVKILLGILVVLVILILLNAFALDNETDSAKLTVPDAQLVETTSGQLQVLDTGEPPAAGSLPVVLVHGSAGAINWWDDLIPILRESHRVVAIDMLGYGGSNKPDSDYSIETQAALVAQVLAKLDVRQAVIVGHSLGGKVVTSLAEQSPDLVAGLTLIDTAPDNSFGGLSGGANASKVPLLGQALWRIAPDFMIRRNVAQGFAPGYDVPQKYVDDVRDMTYPAYKESAARSEDYTEDESLVDRLTEVGKPLLVIFGEEDQIYDARQALSAYAAIPGAETLLIPDSGHSPQVEAPEKTAEAINDFAYGIAETNALEQEKARRQQQAKKRAAKARARAKARAQARKKARQSGKQTRKKPQKASTGN